MLAIARVAPEANDASAQDDGRNRLLYRRAYLRRGRPTTTGRYVFVRHGVPIGRPLTPAAVAAIVRRAATRARLSPDLRGALVLRRTAATLMVRSGVSLKAVADILRHRSLNTVMIYTKVDLPTLAGVALPWPEVGP